MERSRKTLLTALLAAALCAAMALPEAVAHADGDHDGPSAADVARSRHQVTERARSVDAVQHRIRATRGRLDTLNTQAEQAVEAYDAAHVRQQRAAADVSAAREIVAIADRQVDVARQRLRKFVASAYMSGGTLTQLKTLALSEGPGVLLEKISTLNVLADQRRDAVAAFDGARAYRRAVEQQAEQALAARRHATAAADDARQAAQRKVTAQQRQLGTLKDESAQLVAALQDAKATAARIAKARKQALAAAKAAERARHAARLRAKADAARRAHKTAQQHAAQQHAAQQHAAEQHTAKKHAAERQATENRHQRQHQHHKQRPATAQTTQAPAPPASTSRAPASSDASGSAASSGGGSRLVSSGGTASAAQAAEAVAWARKQLGDPYVWGAAGPGAFDCSGLVMYVYAKAGVPLDHWTGDQWHEGVHVSRGSLRAGDLLFFSSDGTEAGIHHVGIYVGGGQMIEAPYTGANVRVSSAFRSDLIGAVRP